MKKSILSSLLIASLIFLPFTAMADLGDVIAKSKDIEIEMFGAVKTYPQFMTNIDFNDDGTPFDRIGDENGYMKDHSIRNEARIGWAAKGKDWDFLIILESDFSFNKVNVDRQAGFNNVYTGQEDFNFNSVTANSDDFGIEKLNFAYDFGGAKINVGWNSRQVDAMTGALIYSDDHPYIGFEGKLGTMAWEFLYLTIQDDVFSDMRKDSDGDYFRPYTVNKYDGDNLDWRAYTLRLGFDLSGFTLAPIYAFSDNEAKKANVHYLGLEGFGTFGIFTPRFEMVYAVGDMNSRNVGPSEEYDISAWAAFGALEVAINKAFVPYFGGFYMTGDDDNTDKDVEAYNGISMNQRYTPTFGLENAFIYRAVPVLGSNIYELGLQNLGNPASGYGGSTNLNCGDAPGLIMLGVGARGNVTEQFSYKAQIMYFQAAEEDNFKKILPNGTRSTETVDDMIGVEFDVNLAYAFSQHFSLGNTLAFFFPGDFVEDYRGPEYEEAAIMDTIELNWKF